MEQVKLRIREVHDTLLPVLAETYGEKLAVHHSSDADAGRVVYGFEQAGYHCLAHATPTSERAAGVAMTARLGRCYVGYRRAAHWLACNRAGNTVAFAASINALEGNELWVTSHRVTLPGDADGVRETLADFATELDRLGSGLSWFPQLLGGAELLALEKLAATADGRMIKAVLASPRPYCDWVANNQQEALDLHGQFPVRVLGWLRRWDERLDWLEKDWAAMSEVDQQDCRAGYLFQIALSLSERKRYSELLKLADKLGPLPDAQAEARAVAWRMRALYGLDQYEEALEVGRSAAFDINPRVWFWRSLAHARLGQLDEAAEAYGTHESAIGVDIIGRQKLREAMPPAAEDNQTTNEPTKENQQ